MKAIIILLLFYLFLSYVKQDNYFFAFSESEQNWTFYGEGIGKHDPSIGYSKQGSLLLQGEWQKAHTTYKSFKMSQGIYRVSFYLQTSNVRIDQYNDSFMHFYQTNGPIKYIFKDVVGSFKWRKYSYTIDVEEDLTLWFRIKSSGKAWIDDIQIDKVYEHESFYEQDNPEVYIEPKEITYPVDQPDYYLMKNQIIALDNQQYYNLNSDLFDPEIWKGHNRIHLSVYNPLETNALFFLSFIDEETTNYWGQLNHKTTIVPGINHISFRLDRYVGERGSVRYFRKLDFSKLKKIFMVVNPDDEIDTHAKFKISNIYLSTNHYPIPPQGLTAIDFISIKGDPPAGMYAIDTSSLYDSNNKIGFVNPSFWRVHGSETLSNLTRYSIGVLNSGFKIDIPNGQYKVRLCVDRLGYWDVPFWSWRTIRIENQVVLNQTRDFNQFLDDFFIFDNYLPNSNEDTYSAIKDKVLKVTEVDVNVSDGRLDFEFSGDASAISLNYLFIWPSHLDNEAKSYINAVNEFESQEFNYYSRKINTKSQNPSINRPVEINVLKKNPLNLTPKDYFNDTENELKLEGASFERPFKIIQVRTNSISNLKVSAQSKYKNDIKLSIKYLHYHLWPYDINHETYGVRGVTLRDLSEHTTVSKDKTLFLWVQVENLNELPPGTYESKLIIEVGRKKNFLPITIKKNAIDFLKIDFPVGFMGMNPFVSIYHPSPSVSRYQQALRMNSLNELKIRGFTSVSGIPSMNESQIDDFIKEINTFDLSKTLFTYGGNFAKDLLTQPPEVITNVNEKIRSLTNFTFVYTFSDEASGHSNSVLSETELAKKLKLQLYAFDLGGFSTMKINDPNLVTLQDFFDYSFFSQFTFERINELNNDNKKWGAYNLSIELNSDLRVTFGPLLYNLRKLGLSHYLDWHMNAFYNLAYFSLDGREKDIAMLYPKKDGSLYSTIDFEYASYGLELYKKLILLESINEVSYNQEISLLLSDVSMNYSIFFRKIYDIEALNDKVDELLLKYYSLST